MEQIDFFLPVLLTLYLGLAALFFPVFSFLFYRRGRKLRDQTEAINQRLEQARTECDARLTELQAEHKEDVERYAAIISIEDEIARLEDERTTRVQDIEQQTQALSETVKSKEEEIETLRSSYKEKRVTYDRLKRELSIFDERLSLAGLGVYEPHFDYGDSEAFKEAIKAIREEQKAMVASKTAVFCLKEWTVDGSKSKGETMVNRAVRLTLRAFNNECEAAIANTRWNNVQAMEKRIERAKTAINKLNASNSVIISDDYHQAKLKELRLTHEYRETLKREREERAEAARLEREEKRLQQQAKAAEKEEQRYQKLLEKARTEAGVISSDEHEAKIRELEEQLAAAREETERAKAMAEQTRSGFVYVISNIGSFGDDIVKIGLTRRLDPADRVRELGDASVPFLFDTHAMIYSEEAPALEAALHAEFGARRVNAANMRKEFFRVTLEEVEEAVRRLAPDADFHTDVEAQEYFETLARRQELAEKLAKEEAEALPLEI
ncbi:DUF4041 domain-containing protein [Ruegeria sp. THAF33]|uniref:DUF4041 domain-containing protein n=1 Tax=Ruegeria sp. THAF33 TaxID=2587853 RepID=UPI001269846B|nr:DUF4041 domain-containing protein [Ruegeria sp. THAF33]QFT74026.1 hypothetical protein FIU92_13390 [Ruegeria sp. THAF33]